MLTTSAYNRDLEQAQQYSLVKGFITKPLMEEMLKQISEGKDLS